MGIKEILEKMANEICDSYCKYPESYDEEKEGCELADSDICRNCPLTKYL